jgi:hypothetical protein
MKKVLKITGIAALALILVCNLEYAMFSGDMKSTPNKAFADHYTALDGTVYCGTSPDKTVFAGYWEYIDFDDYAYNHPSDPYPIFQNDYGDGFYVFTPDDEGPDCGPNTLDWEGHPYNCCGTNPQEVIPFPYPQYTTNYSGGFGSYPNI